MTAPRSLEIIKESIDKRRRPFRYVYTLIVDFQDQVEIEILRKKNVKLQFSEQKEDIPEPTAGGLLLENNSAVVVGAGPAGLFAAYVLAKAGAKVVLLERGEDVSNRLQKVRKLFKEGILDGESNICFGEGGAGTFSDGKLTTRKNHPWIRWVFEELVACGAPESILTSGKPHIGSDRLRAVVVNFRNKLIELGVDVRFSTLADEITVENKKIIQIGSSKTGWKLDNPDAVIWATGHSSRDSIRMLHDMNIPMQQKPFAIGYRIEHPQELVNQWQHGTCNKDVGAADYSVVCNLSTDRSVYSFCMCPGGQIVCSSSHDGYHVVNGMSNYARNQKFANSGLVVKVGREDFDSDHPLAGLEFQEQLEQRSFKSFDGSIYLALSQKTKDFLENRTSTESLESSYEPGLSPGNLRSLLPEKLGNCIELSLRNFEKRYPGFCGEQSQLIGLETRTSSPVRIERNEQGVSPTIENFYPCGEGAGYAGGIVSAALDGLYIAKCIKSLVI